MTAWMGSKFGKIGPVSAEVAALERLEKIPLAYNGRNGWLSEKRGVIHHTYTLKIHFFCSAVCCVTKNLMP